MRAELYEVGCHVDQCTLDMPVKLYNKFITLNMQMQVGSYAPTQAHGQVYDTLKAALDTQLREPGADRGGGSARGSTGCWNRSGLPAVHVPARKPIA